MNKYLSENELERLRKALERERERLIEAMRSGARRGEPQGETEQGDIAERYVEQESAEMIASFDEPLLTEVDHALAKIEDGSYGTSEESGAPIPLERLEAVPWARRTFEEELRRH